MSVTRFLHTACIALLASQVQSLAAEPADAELARWLGPQEWQRDTDGPILSLGKAGTFDDEHLLSPCAARIEGQTFLWYCGSRGNVEDRVFALGLATSRGGQILERHAANPVLKFADGRHSVLTPTLLTDGHGNPLRENGKLRLWFSSTDFHDKSGLHTLHESTSDDGVRWSLPSSALLEGVYAPTVLRDGDRYRLWFTDVSQSPWLIRHAESKDGTQWQVDPEPVLRIDQAWESNRLFYPTVRQVEGVLILWYGSYWKGQEGQKTALGVAASRDGRTWTKSPHNPVLRPDDSRPWESHYTTSQSLIRAADGTWRIWYASRPKPPFTHKYFAINTATWTGPSKSSSER